MKKKLSLLVAGVLSLGTLLPGCSKKEYVPEKAYPNTDYITRYMEARDTIEVAPLANGYAAYFDFSDGVNLAYADPVSKDNLHNFVNAVTTPETDFYALGSHQLTPMSGDTEQIFQDILNPSNYKQQAAPIRKALQQILDQNKPALLVTDYEEYDGEKIFKGAYAKQFFIDWLKRGYDITFYIVDYKENGKSKKLFYTVFDGKEGSLNQKIRNGLHGKPVNYKTFTMGNNNYKMITDYPSAAQGGNYHNEYGVDDVTYVCEDPKDDNRYVKMENFRAEYYPLQESFQRINRLAALKAIDAQKDYPPTVFRYFVQNLFISTADLPYKDVELGMNVYSVQDDYEQFDRHLTAIMTAPTGNNDDPYYEPDGTLRTDYVYTPQPLNPVHDLFVFVDKPTAEIKGYAENGGKTHDGFREVGFTFSPNFDSEAEPVVLTGNKVSYQADDLIRVDIVIKDVDYLTDSELNPLFKWGDYDNLSESVRLALQEANPKGKVLYTYYISPGATYDQADYSKDIRKALLSKGLPNQFEYYEESAD